MIQSRITKQNTAMLFLLTVLFFPASSMAQVLYGGEDNTIMINVPGIDASKLEVTAQNGTIVYKEADQWVARPTGEKYKNGIAKDFVIMVSAEINGVKTMLAAKKYNVEPPYIIDYYDVKTHKLRMSSKLLSEKSVKLKADGIEKLCFKMTIMDRLGNTTVSIRSCDFLFSEKQKNMIIAAKYGSAYLSFTEIYDISGKKTELPPIEIKIRISDRDKY